MGVAPADRTSGGKEHRLAPSPIAQREGARDLGVIDSFRRSSPVEGARGSRRGQRSDCFSSPAAFTSFFGRFSRLLSEAVRGKVSVGRHSSTFVTSRIFLALLFFPFPQKILGAGPAHRVCRAVGGKTYQAQISLKAGVAGVVVAAIHARALGVADALCSPPALWFFVAGTISPRPSIARAGAAAHGAGHAATFRPAPAPETGARRLHRHLRYPRQFASGWRDYAGVVVQTEVSRQKGRPLTSRLHVRFDGLERRRSRNHARSRALHADNGRGARRCSFPAGSF